MGWTDSHCHLQEEPDAGAVLDRARRAGVERLICVGTDAAWSRGAVELARSQAGVWATVGLHPHDADAGVDTVAGLFDSDGDVIVAVGECGLDYHYDNSPRPAQREAFAAQVGIARDRGLPLVVHTREAWDDTFDILKAEGVPERVIFHCFTGGPEEARRCLEIGGWLSFSGIVSFPKAPEIRQAAALCPADRLLVETDSPFLAPVPHRGRRNEPAFVPLVGAAVAAARGEDPEAVESASWLAASAAFGLD
ncbi:MAG TPA: TatD family hydrolase [Acidimicrobiales bacterium]|nr:TatD family hydrolase [Acidimicrobiales bacterium]